MAPSTKNDSVNQYTESTIQNKEISGTHTWNDLKGFLIGIPCSMSVAISAGCVQALKRAVPDMQLNGFRFTFLFIFTLPFLLKTKQGVRIEKGIRFWTFLCALFSVLSNVLRYLSVNLISLGHAGSVTTIGAMFILILTGKFFFKESLTVLKVGAMVAGCTGILLLYQPGFNLGDSAQEINAPLKQANASEGLDNCSKSNNIEPNHDLVDLLLSTNIDVVVLGIISATLAAIFGSGEIIVQKAKLQKLNGLVFCFWFGALGTVTSFLGSVLLEDMTLPTSLNDIILTSGHCIAAAFISISNFYSHKYASFMVVSLAASTQLFFMFLGQYLILEDVVYGLKMYVEIGGAVLSVMSASVVPLVQFIQYKRNQTRQVSAS